MQALWSMLYSGQSNKAIAHHTHYYISQLSDIHKSIHTLKYVYSCVYH